MLRSSLCDYSDAYILVSGTIMITGAGVDDAIKQSDKIDKRGIFKNCATLNKNNDAMNHIL